MNKLFSNYNNHNMLIMRVLLSLIFLLPFVLLSQHAVDTTYHPNIHDPAYEQGSGPVIYIDEGHNNWHTMSRRYKPFSSLLARDGYVVKPYTGIFDKNKLEEGKILVISNALSEDVEDYTIPEPSAFSPDEINILAEWVANGGSLFLIADHMPMADASKDLAAAFGFKFTNGFVFDTVGRGVAFFKLEDKTLVESIITEGRDPAEKVNEVVTFTGQAFQVPDDARSILTFNDAFENYLPDTAWVFDETTIKQNVNGWSQGAITEFGKGKVAVFGEAAMFTAQLAGPEKRKGGMNSDFASQNFQFLLNIIHWLDGMLE